jgi:hypothetical protein
MRFTLATLLTITLSFIAGLYLPWWSIALVAFLVALLIKQTIGWAYLSAFTAIYLLWGGLSLFIHIRNKGVLTQKISNLLPLNGSAFFLLTITALAGAVVAGFAAMSGSSLHPAERGLVKEGANRTSGL